MQNGIVNIMVSLFYSRVLKPLLWRLPIRERSSGEAENIERKNLLEYVQSEQKRNIDVSTINIGLSLSCISKYFEFLKTENIITRNPARTLRIKGELKTITEQPLKYEELEQLYFAYKSLNKEAAKNVQQSVYLSHQRNIIIVGLLVWQGLHSGELEKL